MKNAGESIFCQVVQHSEKPLHTTAIHRVQSGSLAVHSVEIDYSKIRRRRSMTLEQITPEILAFIPEVERFDLLEICVKSIILSWLLE